MLARTGGARLIVEFGTSFGVSTIFLAAALRDMGGGRIISTELFAAKAERANANVREAGLADLVDIRIGDARETLRTVDGPAVDLILLDAAKPLYLDVLRLLEPRLRAGALVVSDRADLDGGDGDPAADYRSYVADPANGYRMASIATQALGRTFLHDIAIRI